MTEVFACLGDTQQDAVICPYKGLGSYTEADKDYFFARDSFRDLVAANLMASRLTVLYGRAALGKAHCCKLVSSRYCAKPRMARSAISPSRTPSSCTATRGQMIRLSNSAARCSTQYLSRQW